MASSDGFDHNKKTFLSKLRSRFRGSWYPEQIDFDENCKGNMDVQANNLFTNFKNYNNTNKKNNIKKSKQFNDEPHLASKNCQMSCSLDSSLSHIHFCNDSNSRPLSCSIPKSTCHFEDPGYSTLDEMDLKKGGKVNESPNDSGLESDSLSPQISLGRISFTELPVKLKDSIKSEFLPELPPRLYSEEDRQYALTRCQEKIHMSMNEVLEEAKLLGIPMKVKRNDKRQPKIPPRSSSLNRNSCSSELFATSNSRHRHGRQNQKDESSYSKSKPNRYSSPTMRGRRLPLTPLEIDPKTTSTSENNLINVCKNNDESQTCIDEHQQSQTSEIKAETKTGMQLFMESMAKLREMGYYWGPLTANEAECKLADLSDGCFLVRDSSDERHLISISFRSNGGTHHTRIEHSGGLFHFKAQPKSMSAATIVEFIENSVEFSKNERFHFFVKNQSRTETDENPMPPVLVKLLTPVSRFFVVQSLKHLVRMKIGEIIRKDHIDLLPLPPTLKNYLHEATLCSEK